jgi:tRNA (guanine-N7-)-methyltransferase
LWLEIGFGGGEHLLWQARTNPGVGLIGAEPYVSGVAKLLSKLASVPAPNLRLYTEDATDIIEALPDASLGRVFVLFPDPWPKTRHHKRRFIRWRCSISSRDETGAELRFATDDKAIVWTLERLSAHPGFRGSRTGPGLAHSSSTARNTLKPRHQGGHTCYLRFVRTH